MKKFYVLALAIGTFGLASNAMAVDIAVGAKVSTLGVGVDLTTNVAENLNVRAGVQLAQYGVDAESDGVNYEADLELFSGLLTAEWHVFDGGFRINGGLLVHDNKVTGTGYATQDATYTINDTVYTAADVGRLDAEISYNSVAPYLGIGWGNPVSEGSNWTVSFDLGVAFMGSPSVDVSASGPIASNASFMADLEQERKDLEDDLGSFSYYPVIALGLSYKF